MIIKLAKASDTFDNVKKMRNRYEIDTVKDLLS